MKVIKLIILNSTEREINVKMPKIVLTFTSTINTTSESLKARKVLSAV